MKTLKTVSRITSVIGLAGILLAPAVMSAPGQGWDIFNMGQGESVPAGSKHYIGTSSNVGGTGKGWDTFNTGQGEKIPAADNSYKGTSSGGSTGKGWDAFGVGQGDRL